MTIVREINGVRYEFELTGMELAAAYSAHQHIIDMEDVRLHYPSRSDKEIEAAATEARASIEWSNDLCQSDFYFAMERYAEDEGWNEEE